MNSSKMGNKYTKVKINTRKTCIAEPREARGGKIEVHKMSGMEGGENWSKIIMYT